MAAVGAQGKLLFGTHLSFSLCMLHWPCLLFFFAAAAVVFLRTCRLQCMLQQQQAHFTNDLSLLPSLLRLVGHGTNTEDERRRRWQVIISQTCWSPPPPLAFGQCTGCFISYTALKVSCTKKVGNLHCYNSSCIVSLEAGYSVGRRGLCMPEVSLGEIAFRMSEVTERWQVIMPTLIYGNALLMVYT
jgi:hypothetical protein